LITLVFPVSSFASVDIGLSLLSCLSELWLCGDLQELPMSSERDEQLLKSFLRFSLVGVGVSGLTMRQSERLMAPSSPAADSSALERARA